jgi:hypothetical protein
MPNVSDPAVPQQSARGSNATKRLIQAAALASALVPLGSVAADAAIINIQCDANGGGCTGGEFGSGGGLYEPEGSGVNTWGFYDGDTLLYTFQITGEASNEFELFVSDFQFDSQSTEPPYDIPFLNGACIPLVEGDDQTASDDLCVIFDVFTNDEVNWVDGYYVEMRWFAPLGPAGQFATKPPDDGRNFIFRAADGFNFDDPLVEDNLYLPQATPDDPALGGRGDVFSSFIAGRADVSAPEPATLLLLGTGLAATLYRRRRR